MTAADYRDWLSARERVGESSGEAVKPGDELAWQARWFAGDFGWHFTAVTGEQVRIVQPGVWNRESGPDFAEAAISINGGEVRRGAIELDLEARDWERHGHAENPHYEAVELHLFFEKGPAEFFTRTSTHRNVLQVQLRTSAAARESLPDGLLAKPGRCSAPLALLPAERVQAILEAAAAHRLQQKAARLAQVEQAHGADEALYQALAESLGYKSNKLAFLLLAQRIPLKLARSAEGEALLFGVSGFLPGDVVALPPDTKQYVRAIWERWWRLRAAFERLTIPGSMWKMSGHRPVNHPQRRVAALAAIARKWHRLRALLEKGGSGAELAAFFAAIEHEFWTRHYTLSSKPAPRELALVGEERVTQMLANVFYPWRWRHTPECWADFLKMRAASGNRKVATAATRLFGAEPPRKWLQREAWQQGLLQIYEDFCLQDVSDCADCPFPRQLASA